MKKILLIICAGLTLIKCEDPDTYPLPHDEEIRGAFLRTLTIDPDFASTNIFEIDDKKLSFKGEIVSEGNGSDVKNVILTGKFKDNNVSNTDDSVDEKEFKTIPITDFTKNAQNRLEYDFNVRVTELLKGIGITNTSVLFGGDQLDLGIIIEMNDGKRYSFNNTGASIRGELFFKGNMNYTTYIKCIPKGAVPGIYSIALSDSYGDGWQGSLLKVTIDGVTKNYGIPSSDADYNAILEPISGDTSSGKAIFTIPEGTNSIKLEWVSGEYPGECSYTIEYTKLDGSSKQVAITESTPSEGEKTLSICN
jgi:hypothetical protein